MPFQSEKQRRYLWANEPEIARDWTDTYGSGIAKALGGRIPFYAGSGVASNIDNPANLENQYAKITGKQMGQMDATWPYLQSGAMDLQNFYENTKAWDDTGSEGFWGMGKRDPEPMTTDEFKNEMINRGYLKLPGKSIQDFNKLKTRGDQSSVNNLLDKRYVSANNIMSDATYVDDTTGINSIPFDQEYLQGSGWLTDARTADEMAQLPIDPLKNKRQKLTDFLSRFIPGGTVAKMLRPDANEAYGNVAGLYPEEVWGMQEFGTGEDLRTDKWGKNIVSHAGDYEEGIKDWWEKYGKMEYQTPRMKQKKAWKRNALAKIIEQEKIREATKRATVQQMSERNRIENTGGWQSGMAADPGFMTGPAQGEQLSDVMGSFNRGGLAGLWRR